MDDYSGKPKPEKPLEHHYKERVPKELVEVLTAATVGEIEEEIIEKNNMPEWDGSEAEFIADEDANEYEDQYSGIKLKYKLNKDEVKSCLKKINYKKKINVISVIEIILLIVAFLVFVSWFFIYGGYSNLVLAGISLIVIIAIWNVPNVISKSNYMNRLYNEEFFIEVFPDEIIVKNETNSSYKIKMDQKSSYEESDNIIFVYSNNKMLPIPLRAIEPSVIGDVQAIIVSGSKPL